MTIATGANAVRTRLEALVGEWEVELSFPNDPPGTVHIPASFAWLEDGDFLLYRLGDTATGAPHSTCIIGGDASTDSYAALYADDRGVSRVYQMRLDGGEWTMWRKSSGFSQRFVGTFDGDAIIARWEKSPDDVHWEHDFDLRYRRLT